MYWRSIVRYFLLHFLILLLFVTGITVLLCFPQNFKKLLRPLCQKFRLLVVPIDIGFDYRLYDLFLRTVEQSNIGIIYPLADFVECIHVEELDAKILDSTGGWLLKGKWTAIQVAAISTAIFFDLLE